jgi:uncharacterized protein
MPRRIETLFLQGKAGRLEALLEEPEHAPPVEGAVICHPHPQHGGTMHNKVVYRLARGLRKTQCVVLRFNYRGVNLSDGEYGGGLGETDDARTAFEELRARYPDLSVLLAGFSFGAHVALRLAATLQQTITRAIAVGFPTVVKERDFVHRVSVPKHFVQSTHDEFGPRPAFTEFFESLPEPKSMDWVEASDHFFRDALDRYEEVIERIGNAR